MLIRIKLEQQIGRIVFLIGLCATCALLAWLVSRHFIVRTLTDRRLNFSVSVLAPAVNKLPNSPNLRRRIVEAWLASDEIDYAAAYEHAQKAVQLNPRSGKAWYELFQIQTAQNLSADAEQSLWRAAELAPSDSEVNWALANLLVRTGSVDESVVYFRQAVQLNKTLYPLAYDTLWQASGRKLEVLKSIANGQPAALVYLAQYLAGEERYAECSQVFEGQKLTNLAALPPMNDLINQLIQAGQPLVARKLWADIQWSHPSLQKDALVGGFLWDGGFEFGRLFELHQFDWTLRDSDYARVGFDQQVKKQGRYSLKFLFTGRDTTALQNEVSQRLALVPKRHYRLAVAVKTQGLQSPEGPRLAIIQAGKILSQSVPILNGTQDWQTVQMDFIAPDQPNDVICTIIRFPKLAYEEPTTGTIWFDEFNLVELES